MTPPEIREIFGRNLRTLIGSKTVSEVCREIGINRTQFNRYLSHQSSPRSDVLHRLCQHFDCDARVLLELIETHQEKRHAPSLQNRNARQRRNQTADAVQPQA